MSSIIQRLKSSFTRTAARSDSSRADSQSKIPGSILDESGTTAKPEPFDWVSQLTRLKVRDINNTTHRELMAELQPCAKLWTRDIATTVFDNWFQFVDKDGNPLDEMDVVLDEFKRLRMEEVLKRACMEERKHGWSVIYKVYEGARLRTKSEEGLMDYLGDPSAFQDSPAPAGREIQWLEPLPTKCLRVDQVDEWNTPIMLNYLSKLEGEVPGGSRPVNIPLHATRCWWISPRPRDRHWAGYTALADIWDCCVALNEHLDNMTWYAGKVGYYKEVWMKHGALNDSEASRMKTAQQESSKRRFEMIKSGVWDPPQLLAPPVGQSAFGEQIDKLFELMSSGTGITSARWKGAQAGELEGSRTNLKLERAVISAIQDSYEPILRAIIEDLFPGQFHEYEFEWIQAEQFDEIEKAELESVRADIVAKASAVMTRAELRERLGLSPDPAGPTLAEEQRDALLSLQQQSQMGRAGASSEEPSSSSATTPPRQPTRSDAWAAIQEDRFPAWVQGWEDRGYSRNQIIKTAKIGRGTFFKYLSAQEAEPVELHATL